MMKVKPATRSKDTQFIYRFDAESVANLVAANLRKIGVGTEVRFIEPRFWELWAVNLDSEKAR